MKTQSTDANPEPKHRTSRRSCRVVVRPSRVHCVVEQSVTRPQYVRRLQSDVPRPCRWRLTGDSAMRRLCPCNREGRPGK